jgi:ArsR family transcriptional regulator, arsenate/arsenite/antimonite-responsive transcriptional repressor
MNISLQTEPNALSRQLAALSHPARIDILQHLACDDGRCCKEVVGVLDLAQSTVSQHLKVLVDAGLVDLFIEGKRSRYCLNRAALTALKSDIDSLFSKCAGSPCAGAQPHLSE